MSKKMYTAPVVMAANFGLSTGVSSGCAAKATFAEFTCPVEVPEWGLTFFGDDICDYSTPDGNDMVCYHVPTADSNVFTS